MTPNDWKILAHSGVTPDNLTVGGWIDLRGTAITALPDNLTVGGSLDLRGTAITALPDNLTVGGSLDLEGTAITALPDNLTVGGSLYLEGTAIPVIYDDPDRPYQLRRVPRPDGAWYVAGCRMFRSASDALSHWGSAEYPCPERGAAYCAAIRKAESVS